MTLETRLQKASQSLPLSLGSPSGEGRPPCCKDAQAAPQERGPLPLDRREHTPSGKHPSAPAEPAALLSILAATPWKTLNQNLPAEPLLGSRPSKPCEIRTVCCFKLLRFGVTCDIATDELNDKGFIISQNRFLEGEFSRVVHAVTHRCHPGPACFLSPRPPLGLLERPGSSPCSSPHGLKVAATAPAITSLYSCPEWKRKRPHPQVPQETCCYLLVQAHHTLLPTAKGVESRPTLCTYGGLEVGHWALPPENLLQ